MKMRGKLSAFLKGLKMRLMKKYPFHGVMAPLANNNYLRKYMTAFITPNSQKNYKEKTAFICPQEQYLKPDLSTLL